MSIHSTVHPLYVAFIQNQYNLHTLSENVCVPPEHLKLKIASQHPTCIWRGLGFRSDSQHASNQPQLSTGREMSLRLTNGTETTVNGLFHNFRFESNFWCILLITVADAMTPNPLTDLETNRRASVFSLRCADPHLLILWYLFFFNCCLTWWRQTKIQKYMPLCHF